MRSHSSSAMCGQTGANIRRYRLSASFQASVPKAPEMCIRDSSKHAAGGIAGYNQGLNGTALIQYCYNLGSVTGGKNECIGGIVGCNQASNGSAQVLYCYNTGIVYLSLIHI